MISEYGGQGRCYVPWTKRRHLAAMAASSLPGHRTTILSMGVGRKGQGGSDPLDFVILL